MTPLDSDPAVNEIAIGLFGALAVATLVRGLVRVRSANAETRSRWSSMGTWWVLWALFVAVLALGRPAVVVAAAAVSLLILRECLQLLSGERALPWAVPAVAGLYLWAWLDWSSLFLRFLPLSAFGWVAAELAWRRARGRLVGRPALPAFVAALAVVGPSYLVAVASLPAPEGSPPRSLGWFVLLVVLTELNDIAQAWWGRSLGRRPMAPELSPHKTWAGLWGGLVTTAAVAIVLAPRITSYGRVGPHAGESVAPLWAWSLAIALLLGIAGVAGDLSASALKRRAGVKDSGRLLPGHGGVLDRFDSLAWTAPAYFAMTWLLWYRTW